MIIIIGTITCISILFQYFNWFLTIITFILLVLFIVIASLFLKKCLNWYASYMTNGKSNFHPKVDKPRVFLFSIFLPLLFIIVSVFNSFEGFEFQLHENVNLIFNAFFCTSLVSLFAVVLLFLFKTLGSSFENLYLPKVKEIVQKSTCDFKSTLLPANLTSLFDRLLEYDFLSYEDLEEQKKMKEKFIDIFSSGLFPQAPLFKLNMDNVQTHVLFKKLNGNGVSITLGGMGKIFMNENGILKAKSISNSYNQRAVDIPKNNAQIIALFYDI